MFKVTLPSIILFESIDEAVWFAKLLSNAHKSDYISIYDDESRDGRHHYIHYMKPIDLNINFQANDYLENKWEALDKLASIKASAEEIEDRKNMTEEDRKVYLKELKDKTPEITLDFDNNF